MTSPPIALTIAGSDSGGGAGIQADLKTFSALGVYGTSAITALTAQNTQGVRAVHAPSGVFLAQQIEAVLEDMPVGAIKIGMLFNAEIIHAVAAKLACWPAIPAVLDPVMIATSGDALIRPDAVSAMVAELFPLARVVTPNLAEAAFLLNEDMARDLVAMERQGRAILAMGAHAVLMKGGHSTGNEAIDLLVTSSAVISFAAPRIETRNTHGTGCTLSSAIAAGLAKGMALEEAIEAAKKYLTAALEAGAGLRLGKGSGPVHHFYAVWNRGHAR